MLYPLPPEYRQTHYGGTTVNLNPIPAVIPQIPLPCHSLIASTAWVTICADSAGATGNFALELTDEPGKTSRFTPVPFRGLF